MTGHEMWMAGASEVVYSMLMMRHGFIAPNINFTEGDEATSKLNIPVRRVDTEFDCFLSNTASSPRASTLKSWTSRLQV